MSSLTRPSHYNTSAYPPYGGSTTSYGGSGSGNGASSTKNPVQEEEVDALTSLLVQSMDNAADPEFFGKTKRYLFGINLTALFCQLPGMCADCGLKVVGEGTGCTAMDRVYHIACFTCRIWNCRLQGKPFYAVDGEPDCQECYLVSRFCYFLLLKHYAKLSLFLRFELVSFLQCVCYYYSYFYWYCLPNHYKLKLCQVQSIRKL